MLKEQSRELIPQEIPRKDFQTGTKLIEKDPEYMTPEIDGQQAFDDIWEEGDTITPDGYLNE